MRNIILAMILAMFAVGTVSLTAVDADAKSKKMKKKKKMKKPMMEESAEYEVPYGMAGCGIWAGVIKDRDKYSQFGVWALRTFVVNSQTSAITTGTSNCVDTPGKVAAMEQKVFMEVNLNSLSREAAQGQGEHLNALAQVFGCDDQEAFAKLSQSRYTSIFSDGTPENVLNNYKNEVRSDSRLASDCERAAI